MNGVHAIIGANTFRSDDERGPVGSASFTGLTDRELQSRLGIADPTALGSPTYGYLNEAAHSNEIPPGAIVDGEAVTVRRSAVYADQIQEGQKLVDVYSPISDRVAYWVTNKAILVKFGEPCNVGIPSQASYEEGVETLRQASFGDEEKVQTTKHNSGSENYSGMLPFDLTLVAQKHMGHIKSGELLEMPESYDSYNITGNGKCDMLKNIIDWRISIEAPEYPISMENVQRLDFRGRITSNEVQERPTSIIDDDIVCSLLKDRVNIRQNEYGQAAWSSINGYKDFVLGYGVTHRRINLAQSGKPKCSNTYGNPEQLYKVAV